MTLIAPLNDTNCLALLHDEVERYKALPPVRELAEHFDSLAELRMWIRGLKQRDDLGDPDDGPRLPCEVSQRARFAPSDPNCYERTILYHALAEMIEPDIERTSASLAFPEGWHTFPVEFRNDVPDVVTLDPYEPPKNAMVYTAYRTRNLSPARDEYLAPWFLEVVYNAALEEDADDRVDDAIRALRNGLTTGEPIDDLDDLESLEFVIALAREEGEAWGREGRKASRAIEQSIRNFTIKLDTKQVGKFIGTLLDHGQKLAPSVIRSMLIAQFGPVAELALQHADVAMEGGQKPEELIKQIAEMAARAEAEARAKAQTQSKSTATTTATAKADDDKQDSSQRMRHMSLAFR